MTERGIGFGPVVLLGLAFFLLAAWCFSHRRVDRSLAVLALYLGLLDGYLKLRIGSPILSLGRDVLIIAISAGALLRTMSSRHSLPLPPLAGLVLAFAAIVLVELFNPRGPGFLQGLAGVRSHLEFVPLFFLGYAFVRRESQVRALVLILVVSAAVGGVVALFQSWLTPEELAQWGPGYRDRIYGAGALEGAGRVGFDAEGNPTVRPFGLGSEVGGAAAMAALALPGLLVLMINASTRRPMILGPLAIGIALAVVTSGSRAATIAVFFSAVAFGITAAVSKNALRAIAGLAVAAVLLYAVFQQVGPDNPAKNRTQSVTPDKVVTTFSQERASSVKLFGTYASKYPLGVGVGTMGSAASITGRPNVTGLNGETLWNFLVLETGLAGLAVMLALIIRLLWLALTRIRRVADPVMRLYLAALAAPLFSLGISGFAGPTTVAVPFAPYLWLVAGILSYWLIAVPRKVSAHAAEPDPDEPLRPSATRARRSADLPRRAPIRAATGQRAGGGPSRTPC